MCVENDTTTSSSVSDDTKQRRREKLAAWKSTLQLTLPEAPKKPSISFSLLNTKKTTDKPNQPKLELLDYSADEAQIAQTKDGANGHEADHSLMDIESNNDVLPFSAAREALVQKNGAVASVNANIEADVIDLAKPSIDDDNDDDDDDDDVDPFDAYMAEIDEEVTQLKQESVKKALLESKSVSSTSRRSTALPPIASESSKPKEVSVPLLDDDVSVGGGGGPVVMTVEEDEDDDLDDIQRLAQVNVRKQLESVDHTKVQYESFRKEFYIEVPELTKMTEEEVSEYRKNLLEGVRIRGKDCPKPIKTFAQSGLSGKLLDRLKKMKFERPTPIQAQALPAIMSGRDVIGIAKTGSGKTLAFLLPLMRHILAQRDLSPGEGPIGLIMVPTRELATQINSDIREFRSATGIVSCCIYGGADMSSQIADLKRGAHIVVCTPGRMIEMLAMNKGRVTNLRRVTFLVIDEADRMFDLGFEGQIIKMVNNVRPDRQTVMFSATFPRQVEAAARKILSSPLEITVHGRSVVSDTINQIVQVIDHSAKFYRLMELISEWYIQGSILVFAESQKAVDMLFANVIKSGYDALSFHAGRDQTDRDETIEKFKEGSLRILIATSGASRGLDVPGLNLVVNYDVPNHLEDYVHRVGRTGRAGMKGTAVTFIAPDEEQFAGDILKALKQSNSKNIPEDLIKMAEAFEEKQKQGLARKHASGFVGKGYQFSEEEDKLRKAEMNSLKLHFGGDLAEEQLASKDEKDATAEVYESDSEESEISTISGNSRPNSVLPYGTSAGSQTSSSSHTGTMHGAGSTLLEALVPEAELVKMTPQQRAAAEKFNEILMSKAQQASLSSNSTGSGSNIGGTTTTQGSNSGNSRNMARPKSPEQHFDDEIEINDFPQQVRRKITSKETFVDLVELTGVAITPKGIYVVPGKPTPPGERKLYLSIEGPSQEAVTQARNGIRAVLESSMANFALRGDRPAGRYTVD
jgi:ATP-dependent RNA helicase DDX46/PRP5